MTSEMDAALWNALDRLRESIEEKMVQLITAEQRVEQLEHALAVALAVLVKPLLTTRDITGVQNLLGQALEGAPEPQEAA